MADESNSVLDKAEVARLFSLAVAALRKEDASLTKARARAGTWSRSRRKSYAQGLAYWVFESTLVYAVFKAWSKAGKDVEWEWPYGRSGNGDPRGRDREGEHSAQKADLVLFSQDTPTAVFEFKWWHDDRAKTRKAIWDDINKLRAWTGAPTAPGPQTFLIAMWYSPKDDREKDRQDVLKALGETGGARVLTLEVPISYFDTVGVERKVWDFAVAIIRA